MKTLNSYLKLIFIVLVFCSASCEKKEFNLQNEKISSLTDFRKTILQNRVVTNPEELYYYSNTSNKKYDYHISGKDENGEDVSGVINLKTEIGIGVVKKDDDAKEIEIISEHINSRRIIATDMNGFIYKLKLDEE